MTHPLDAFSMPERLVAFDIGAAGDLQRNWKPYAALLSVYAFDAREGSIRNPAPELRLEFNKIECAVGGAVQDDRPFYISRGRGGSSFFKFDPVWANRVTPTTYSELVEETTLPVRTLSDVIASGDAPMPHFMKLDTQGSELEILRALEPPHRKELMGLISEVEFLPVYKDQPLFEDVHAEMRSYGLTIYDLRTHRMFRPAGGERFSWFREHKGFARPSVELSGRLLAGDALYIRDFEDRPPGSLIEVKRLALVLLMHNFFDQAWAMIDSAERETIIDPEDSGVLKEAVVDLCPSPRYYQRSGQLCEYINRLREALGFEGPRRVTGWTVRSWPNQ